ncbi:MAG TPA: cytochrome b [Methylophilaceae bacterium]|jgi:cytochrome b561
MLNDNRQRYGTVSRFFHWVMAILIFEQFFKFADRINDGEHWLGDTFGPFHGSIGLILLMLVVLRILWSVSQRAQRPVGEGIEHVLAKATHGLMYLAVLALPFLGMLYVYGKGYPVKFFGMVLIAKPAGETEWAISVGSLHSPVAILLALLVLGHIGAALYHRFVKKDDVLQRML